VDLATIVTASVAAVAGGVVTAVGSILRTRSTGRTAARLVYAELTRNSAAVGYYCVTGRWPSAQFSHDAWDKQGEALARMHGADTFDCVYRGYSALEAVAYIAGDVTIAADQRTVLLEENLSELRRAITQVGGQATIPSQRVSIETGRLTLPPAASTLSGPASAPPSLLAQFADIQRASGRKLSPALQAATPSVRTPAGQAVAVALYRRVYDAKSTMEMSPKVLMLARAENQPPTGDPAVDETYEAVGLTQTFLTVAFAAPPLRPSGTPFESVVHFGTGYDNVFWSGEALVVGDGGGELFGPFWRCLDVIAHEICHILTAGLAFTGQSGAVNESACDVLGILVKQWHLGQSADAADWVVGKDLLAPSVHGLGLRSLSNPGTAYDDPKLGKDPQVPHMRDYVTTDADNGGVHINSGIPNHAFFLLATSLGGLAWERAGLIWYRTLISGALKQPVTIAGFAGVTIKVAQSVFGSQSAEESATRDAWLAVGVPPRLSKRASKALEAQLPNEGKV